jgi:NTP pyrophosphatase (non-canonical NTP hydrolase)
MTDDNAMSPFTMKEYQEFTPTTAVYDPLYALPYLMSLLGSEVGEVQGKYGKYLRGDMSYNILKESVYDEAGDVMWALSQLFNYFGWTFEEVAERNVAKLRGRQQRGTIRGSGDDR